MNRISALKIVEKHKNACRDVHCIRYFSSFIIISDGRLMHITEPYMPYCPLAWTMYGDMRHNQSSACALNRISRKGNT